ncbi:hypothetical protein PFTANZ_06118, partial [Plasmodium falciparum Tanzania (2000708)]
MGSGSGGGTQEDPIDDKDAKHLLDSIGKIVHDKVKEEAQKRSNGDLKGSLTSSSIWKESVTFHKTCELVEDYNKRLKGKRYPCGKGKEHRFSKESGAECDDSKIEGNVRSKGKDGNNSGACAPYRRLSLCNKNFQNINNDHSSKAKHDLLLDVCLAAKHEGNSINTHYPKYQLQYDADNPDFKTNICTELARSFADIGDIIRRRDLYRGNKQEKEKRGELESKLNDIFKKIHSEVTTTNGAQDRYKGDADNNYFQLREDWWEENRQQVWTAITCDAGSGNNYFRHTCGTGTPTNEKCRCDGANVDPPTYFDYVPQYLRWFEEWAEDFCRKKKIKVENLQKQCRGKFDNQPRYCSRNGFDCEQTIYKKGYFVIDKGCINCLYACNPYVEWIDNQRKQFDKQKKKYDEEIKKYINGAVDSGRRRQKRGAGGTSTTNYEEYEKKFYDELKKHGYEGVNNFLEKLSKEKACQDVKDTEGGKINFSEEHSGNSNVESQGTFYRSDYCQPCPPCGVEKKSNGGSGGNTEWEKKENDKCTKNDKCTSGNLYKPKDGQQGTPINFLYSGDRQAEIETKLEAYCKTQNGTGGVANGSGSGANGSKELYQNWQCYQPDQLEKVGGGEVDDKLKGAGGLCILEKTNSKEEVNKQKTFHNFFYYWVAHMLKDSIHWRTEKLKGCLKNGNPMKCRNGCHGKCDCFKNWIEQKETEWKAIKEQFGKQDFGSEVGPLDGFLTHDLVLQCNLQIEFLKGDSEDASAQDNQNSLDAKEIQHLRQMLKEIGVLGGRDGAGIDKCIEGFVAGQKTLMDKLLKHELQEAEKCKKCPKKPPESPAGGVARSDHHNENVTPPDGDDPEEDEEEEEEEKEEEENHTEEGESKEVVEPQQEDLPSPPPAQEDGAKPACDIVKELFKNPEDFKVEACKQKYSAPNRYWGWKCIPSGSSNTGEGSGDANRRVPRSAETSGPSSSSGNPTGKSGDTGGLCIPPRRRKLYVGKLQEWAEKQSSQESNEATQARDKATPAASQGEASSAGGTSSQSDKLRDAFIESAAVETFFLWHKYKEEKKPPATQLLPQLPGAESDDPQTQLSRGDIPPDFLRQMFYTLGDYRDIFEGKNMEVVNLLKDGSPSDKEMKEKEEKIKGAISSYFQNISEQNGGGGPPSPPDKKTTRESWWEKHGPDIWKGMICALTYKENSSGGEGKKIEKVKTADDKDLFDTLKGKYSDYEKVKLDENSGTGDPRGQDDSQHGQTTSTLLSHFVLRPTYFRYLEEWGQNFCKERKKKLEEIYKDCRGGENRNRHSSGYGEDCDDQLPEDPSTFKDLEYPTCAKYCKFYKKWIDIKKKEFDKQSNAYTKQKKNCEKESKGGDNGFCGTLRNYNDAGDFLQTLKNGPCKKDDDNNDNGENEIDFTKPEETFKDAENCKPCSSFKINCQNDNCSKDKEQECKNKKITPNDIKDPTENIGMLVSDNSTTEIKDEGLKEACEKADIFNGFREDKWKCLRALLKRWVEYFLEDYKKIKHKISHCTKSENKSKCIRGCNHKCNCVKQWIAKKREEWQKIKNHYLEKNKEGDKNLTSLVTNFLETLVTQIAAANDKGKISDLDELEKSLGCKCTGRSEKKNGQKSDIID